MGTAETLIVFSALMALIALVTIGIDWIGKPLKHRRFIPRIYRFDDEKLPVDAYGNTQLTDSAGMSGQATQPNLGPPFMPLPVSPPLQPHAAPQVQPPPVVVAQVEPENATVRVPIAPAAAAAAAPVVASTSMSAFSDSLRADSDEHSTIAGTADPDQAPVTSAPWSPGMPLDTSVEGRKPSLAIKAERFWKTTAAELGDSHFDADNIERMASGKAPRRLNPRTGRTEAMQLTGLRQASAHNQVRMRWPDDAADPWAST